MSVKMVYASGLTPTGFTSQLGTSYTPDVNGAINVSNNDVPSALAAGWGIASTRLSYFSVTTPAAANAVGIVASAALSNGALTIAAQTDVLRPLQVRVDPGTSAITGGSVTLSYVANDGSTVVDILPLAAAASTPVTLNTTKGCLLLNSATVAGLVGGTSPKIQVGTTAALAVPLAQGFSGFSVLRENDDGSNVTIGSVVASAGTITPTAAPNGTHSYSFGYVSTSQ